MAHPSSPQCASQANPLTLFLLCGLPFAGKSTLARALARMTGARRISLDAINDECGLGLRGAPISPAQWDETYREAYRRIAETLAAGCSVVYDETNFLRSQRDAVRTIAADAGAQSSLIWMTTPESLTRNRLMRNRHTGGRNNVRDDDYMLVVTRFEAPGPDEQVAEFDGMTPPEEWLRERNL